MTGRSNLSIFFKASKLWWESYKKTFMNNILELLIERTLVLVDLDGALPLFLGEYRFFFTVLF